MPQPLSKHGPLKSLSIGNNSDSPSRHRPELALLAMQVIAEWSILESFMAGLLVKMLGANPGPAAAMYSSLTGGAAQRAAFRAIADVSINDESVRNVFEATLSTYSSLSVQRNKIVHWTWGHSDDIPDGVLLANPRAMMEYQLEMKVDTDALMAGGEFDSNKNRIPINDIFIYKKVDFEKLSESINALIRQIMELGFVLTGHAANKDGRLLRQLLETPLVREFVNRRNQRLQSGQ